MAPKKKGNQSTSSSSTSSESTLIFPPSLQSSSSISSSSSGIIPKPQQSTVSTVIIPSPSSATPPSVLPLPITVPVPIQSVSTKHATLTNTVRSDSSSSSSSATSSTAGVGPSSTVEPDSSSSSTSSTSNAGSGGYLRIVERSSRQYEANLPDAVFQHILQMLVPEQIARCMVVCQRWKMVCGDEKLWKRICKDTIQRYHPDPNRERVIQKTLQKELSQAADWARSHAANKLKTGSLLLSGTTTTTMLPSSSSISTTNNNHNNSSSSSFASNVVHQGLGSGMYIANDEEEDDDYTDDDDDDDDENNSMDPEVREHIQRNRQSNTITRTSTSISSSSSVSFYRTNTGSTVSSSLASPGIPPDYTLGYDRSPLATTDEDVSLSLAKQAYLNAKKERRMLIKNEIERITVIRNEMVDTFKKYVIQTKSFRTAFRTIPCIRHNGIYSLQHSYVRKGVRDMFHAVAGILKVTYHRTFWFREDGSLLYAMIPGQPFESVREFRRIANNLANAGNSVSSNSNLPDSLLPNSNVHGSSSTDISTKPTQSVTSLSRDRILALNTKDLNTTIGKGWYTLEGRILKAEVITANNILTRWRMEVGSSYHGFNDRLCVLSFSLLEPGADPGAETMITQLNGETFEFRSTPVIL